MTGSRQLLRVTQLYLLCLPALRVFKAAELSQGQWSRGCCDMKLLEEQPWPLLQQHLQQTLTYWSVFFSFGLCVSFLGPTILDLRCQTGATAEQITWVFFSQQFFLLVGSCVAGIFKKK